MEALRIFYTHEGDRHAYEFFLNEEGARKAVQSSYERYTKVGENAVMPSDRNGWFDVGVTRVEIPETSEIAAKLRDFGSAYITAFGFSPLSREAQAFENKGRVSLGMAPFYPEVKRDPRIRVVWTGDFLR